MTALFTQPTSTMADADAGTLTDSLLMPAFAQPVAAAQHHFRHLLQAMSEPGLILTQNPSYQVNAWPGLDNMMTGVLLTLVDHETPLWIAPALHHAALDSNLRFHCAAPLTDRLPEAMFVLLNADNITAELLRRCAQGTDLTPEHSATLLLRVSSWEGGESLILRGPGIATSRRINVPLPPALRAALCEREVPFPCGWDLILTCGDQLMALPRTTQVEVATCMSQ